jgi:hypothetical protein
MNVPRIIQALPDCVSEDTAFIQKDYPYGRSLRCVQKNWLEYSERKGTGFRLSHRTQDPTSTERSL